jgi:GT2 family glycosyltransferase
VPKKFDSVSVIIPSLNGKKVIGATIKSIYRQNYHGKTEIIVTDDGSQDGTSTYIKTHWPKIRLIRFSQNRGSVPALNAAAKIAKGGFILATNDDVIFEKNAIGALVDCWYFRENVGIVTGKMFGPGRKFAIPGFRINHFLGYHPYDFKKRNRIREADWAVGACLFIKKDLLKKVGYFDPGYIFCGEEYDLSFQIKRLGYKILYTPRAVFYHTFRRNFKPNFETLFAHYRGKIRYMFKNAQPWHLLTFLPLQFLIVPIYFVTQKKLLHITAMYKALWWNIIKLPQTLSARHNRPKL